MLVLLYWVCLLLCMHRHDTYEEIVKSSLSHDLPDLVPYEELNDEGLNNEESVMLCFASCGVGELTVVCKICLTLYL